MLSRSRMVTQWSAGVGIVAHGLEVQRDAEGCADLVLAAVALADGAGVVVVHHKLLRQLLAQLPGRAGQNFFFTQRQHGTLEGRQRWVQAQHGAHIVPAVLVLAHNLLVVGLAQKGQRHTVAAQGRLDDIGDVVLARLLVEIGRGPCRWPPDGGPGRSPCGQRYPTARPSQ